MKKIMLSIIVLLYCISLAAAYPVAFQLNSNTDFNTAIYHCSDSTCSALGSLYASDSGNPVSYSLGNEGSGVQYFAEYDYVSDRCYPSHSYRNWVDEDTGNGPWGYIVTFEKAQDCQSAIHSFSYDDSLYEDEAQDIIVNVNSPFSLNPNGPKVVPESLKHYYSTNVKVNARIIGSEGIVAEQEDNLDIVSGSSEDFAFSFFGLDEGEYTVRIEVEVDDCKCSSSVKNIQEKAFTVLSHPEQPENLPPHADFSYSPLKPEVSELVNFDASSSYDLDGAISSYSWDFGDGDTAFGKIVQHSFDAEGNYSIELTVADNEGEISSITKVIEVIEPSGEEPENVPPIANFLYSPQLPIIDEIIEFDGSISYDPDGSIVSYSWSFDDGYTALGVNAQHAFAAAGNHTASLTVVDNEGKESTIIRIIQVLTEPSNQTNLLPFADFSYYPYNPVVNQVVSFDGSLSYDPDGYIIDYSWNFGDGSTANGIYVQHAFAAAGDYPVSLIVTDNSGEKYSQSTVIRIVPVSQTQPQPPQPLQNETKEGKKVKKYGDIDNIALRNFIFKNNHCGNISELTFEVYNQQTGRMSDVKVIVEIPELKIKEESQYFNLGKFESNWLTFNIKLRNVQGSYYARLKVTSHDNENIIIKQLHITCETAHPIISQTIVQPSTQQQQSEGTGGITGNVIAVAKGNLSASGIFLMFFILAIIAVIIKLITLRF